MDLSSAQPVLWRRWGGQQSCQEGVQDGLHVEAVAEAELELGEVAVGVVGEVEGVVRPGDGGNGIRTAAKLPAVNDSRWPG